MKTTILYGNPVQDDTDFSDYIETLAIELRKKHSVDLYLLHTMDLYYCTGCWSCWWKTPGRCSIQDDAEQIFESFISSDFVIFASPLLAGFVSSTLKQITDRLIVLLHPYTQIIDRENHHRKRYDSYPEFGVILKGEADTDEEDLTIVKDMYDRFAINFHSAQKYFKLIDRDSMEDIINATSNF